MQITSNIVFKFVAILIFCVFVTVYTQDIDSVSNDPPKSEENLKPAQIRRPERRYLARPHYHDYAAPPLRPDIENLHPYLPYRDRRAHLNPRRSGRYFPHSRDCLCHLAFNPHDYDRFNDLVQT